MKYCQAYHRYNFKFSPALEEKIYVWFNVHGSTKAGSEKFDEARGLAFLEQCPPSWKIHFKGSQKENMALGKKHSPELSWSTIMTEGEARQFKTPIYKHK